MFSKIRCKAQNIKSVIGDSKKNRHFKGTSKTSRAKNFTEIKEKMTVLNIVQF